MKRTPVSVDTALFPAALHPLLRGAAVYDSSCSPAATVYFIDRDGGYYLKTAADLRTEADNTAWFHRQGLGPEVLHFGQCDGRDWLLTARLPGEDATHAQYLADPVRLCDTLASFLHRLHSIDVAACPLPVHTERYLQTARHNFQTGNYDATRFPDNWGYTTAAQAYDRIARCGHLLASDTLLHGDCCLPNILLDNWCPTGYIDLGSAGVGDRHVDLFWCVWSLGFNLKTERYTARFLDAYGRDAVDFDRLRLVAACEVFR